MSDYLHHYMVALRGQNVLLKGGGGRGGWGDNNATEQLQKGKANSKHVYVVGSYD